MITTDHHHRIFRASEIRSLDEATIRETGISGDVLMEIAGFQATGEIIKRQKGKKRGLIVCGKGNNAGDALVVARYLIRNGYRLTLFFAGGSEGLSPDAATNYERLKKSVPGYGSGSGTRTDSGQNPVYETNDLTSVDDRDLDFAVDGLFGTGLSKEVTGPYRDAIARLNSLGTPIYAMDIPSGLNADTGEVHGIAVEATVTCTFGGYKHGFYTPEGFRCSGDVVLCELPFAPHLYPADSSFSIHPDITLLPESQKMSGRHKYERGIVYILGGSPGLTGAPVLSAKAAWNTGPGAVVVISPAGLLPVFEKNLIEPVKKRVGGADDDYIRTSHIAQVLEIIHEKPGVLLLGPGIGRNNETIGFVDEIIRHAEVPMVIDADALWCLSQAGKLPVFGHQTVLTPHPGELQQLTGKTAMTNLDRLEHAKSISGETGAITVAKGCPTYVTGSASGTFVTAYDTTVFGRAGFGDVLAGKIAAAMSTGHEADAAVIYALLDGIARYRKAVTPDLIPGPSDII
jgi:ADP-dependent NAD(P)H-hydrate dehydratase / NAD(P)H-hydrate epimerase